MSGRENRSWREYLEPYQPGETGLWSSEDLAAFEAMRQTLVPGLVALAGIQDFFNANPSGALSVRHLSELTGGNVNTGRRWLHILQEYGVLEVEFGHGPKPDLYRLARLDTGSRVGR